MKNLSVKERVANGAAWLDKVNPGWEHKIDLSTLELKNSCRCILGQVVAASASEVHETKYGPFILLLTIKGHLWWDWSSGYEVIYILIGRDNLGGADWMADHGFRLGDEFFDENIVEGYSYLDEAWIDLIKSRYDTGEFSDG